MFVYYNSSISFSCWTSCISICYYYFLGIYFCVYVNLYYYKLYLLFTVTCGIEESSHLQVHCDNFFSSVDLLCDLYSMGLYGCGTLRSNRKGFPDDLKSFVKKGLPNRGDSKIRQCDDLTVSVWQDSKPVVAIATNSDQLEITTVLRKSKDGSKSEIDCPQAINLYNKYMGGVDRNDQIRGYYSVRMKGRKFYRYIFWFLFDVSITFFVGTTLH